MAHGAPARCPGATHGAPPGGPGDRREEGGAVCVGQPGSEAGGEDVHPHFSQSGKAACEREKHAMGMGFIKYMPRPSLRPGKSAVTREEWRRRTQSRHEVSALWERPHQVETLGGKSVAAEEHGRSICRGGRTRGPEGHRPQGPSLGCTRQRRRRETGSYSARYGKRSSTNKPARVCEDDRSGRGSVCWGRLDPDLRVSKCSSGGPRTASRTAGNRRRGASGKPACAKKAKAIGEAERESWSDAGGRWHRGGGAEGARGL